MLARNQCSSLCLALLAWGTTLLVGGCSKSEAPDDPDAPRALLADASAAAAPQQWGDFLSWAEQQIQQVPPAVPLPADPHLPETRWPIVRLDEMRADADVTCVWQPAMRSNEPLATLGPFRSDWPRPEFRVERSVDQRLGPAVLLAMTGFKVPRKKVGSIIIEIRVPYGRHIDLIWSAAGTIRVPLPDNQRFSTLKVATDGLTEWLGPLEEIRLRTDGVGEGAIEIRSLRFMPREDAFPEPVGVRRVEVDRETRTAIYTHCPATVRFPNVRLPARAKLQVGLGHVPPGHSRTPGRGPEPPFEAADSATTTEFEIVIAHDERQTSVLKRRLEPGEHWTDVSAGLEAWSGQTVSVTLKTISDTFSSIALWANPFIYEPVDDPPCFILYLIDALAAKHVALYGYQRPTTPNISALAADGVWFWRAFCNSPVTVASVPDTQFSLPTERHGVYASSIPAPLELVSLADALRAAGFATALFSTNAHAGPRQNTDQGFDHFVDRVYCGPRRLCDRTVPLEDVRHWLEVHADRPAYVYIHTAEPHAPYTPPADFAGRFDPNYVGLVDGTVDSQSRPRGIDAARSARDVAHVRALYDEEVLYADTRFGLFLDLLSELGRRAQANIFLIADHGEQLFEHGDWGHISSIHTEVLHIPLVAAGPLVTARGRVDVPVQLHDIMPTTLDMFNLPQPYPLTGTSLLPLLQADQEPDREAFAQRNIFHSHHRYLGYGIVQYAVVEAARWKLMYFYEHNPFNPDGQTTHFALYDLEDYLYDREDIIDSHRDVARRLINELIAYRRQQPPFDADLKPAPLKFDAEQIRELQSLGYVAGDEEEDEDD